MDIALLSKMIGEMVPYHSVIGLPGFGSFVVEDIPAAFEDRGYTINPPYKSLSFIPECSDDSAIVSYYAECNRISAESSRAILTDYLSQLKDLIGKKKAVSFPGLGRLRSTADNRIFFVPDENLAIFPYGIPLDPISLKNHVETEEEINIAVRNLSSILLSRTAPVPDAAPEAAAAPVPDAAPEAAAAPVPDAAPEAAAAPVPDTAPEAAAAPVPAAAPEAAAVPVQDASLKPDEEPGQVAVSDDEVLESETPIDDEPYCRRKHTLLYVILSILVLVVVALSTFLVLVEVNPDFIDSILYTPEELEIINW